MTSWHRVFAALCCTCTALGCGRVTGEERVVIGRIENVLMQDVGMKVKARIDTGAGVSSINAKVIRFEPAEEGDDDRVVFNLTDNAGNTKSIRRTIVEWIEIKNKGTSETTRRPVVIMDMCLGGKKLEGRFTLANRNDFLYPVLVGRNLLKTGDFLIDPKRKFARDHGCESATTPDDPKVG